jgi:hypothetical protein
LLNNDFYFNNLDISSFYSIADCGFIITTSVGGLISVDYDFLILYNVLDSIKATLISFKNSCCDCFSFGGNGSNNVDLERGLEEKPIYEPSRKYS